jgi:histidyl-tRNA synthetase
MTFKALPGFRDFSPDDFALRAHIFAAWRRVAARYGFVEYDGPPLESLEIYTAKSGDEIVGQLFEFVDKGGRHVALRPEMTPTFARMVSARANGLPKPIRWFSIPQLFRYERQQRGRLREHFQLNCDLVGEAGPLADAEVIALAIDVLRELGLGSEDFRVRLSDRRLLETVFDGLDIPASARPSAMQMLDKLGRPDYANALASFIAAGGDEADAMFLAEGLRFATSWDALLELAAPRAALAQALHDNHPLRETIGALKAMGLSEFIELDISIVRGLAYYTGTVFELFDVHKDFRAICGGGRYDSLLATLGGTDLPALGFGMGDVVLGELLKERHLLPAFGAAIDCYVAAVTPEDQAQLLGVVHQLRSAGFATDYALSDTTLNRQLKHASGRGARVVVVIGPDDRASGTVQLKDMTLRTQTAVSVESVVEQCRILLSPTE